MAEADSFYFMRRKDKELSCPQLPSLCASPRTPARLLGVPLLSFPAPFSPETLSIKGMCIKGLPVRVYISWIGNSF